MSTTIPLSVIVLTKNEEKHITDCLESIRWADDIVVIDATSRDRTVELAREFTNSIFVREWMGYAPAKNFALTKAKHEWVLWLDADERVTPELATEIQSIVTSPPEETVGYEVARRAYFLGKWIRHCGWYPGFVVRLFRKTNSHFTALRVHESLELQGRVGRLRNDLLHYTDDTLFHYFDKFNNYTSLAASDARERGRRASSFELLVRPLHLLFKMFILRRGYLDGVHGLLLSLLSSAYVFVKYAKIRESGGMDRN